MYTQAPKKSQLTNATTLMDQSTLMVPTNKLIIKSNSTAVSLYDLKRPQIIRPERIKRKHRRDITTNVSQG